jgi:hypothetical protein
MPVDNKTTATIPVIKAAVMQNMPIGPPDEPGRKSDNPPYKLK